MYVTFLCIIFVCCCCRSVFTQSYDTSESVTGDEGEAGADMSTWAGEVDFVTHPKSCVSHILIAS